MTDRELLEMAAKAAGIEHYGFGLMVNDEPYLKARASTGMWAPLTDDGDALRLATKLGICVVFMEDSGSVGAEHSRHGVMMIEAMDDFGARRAIVRAAAAIGSAM